MKEFININLIQIRNILKILNFKNDLFIQIIRIEENEVIIWRRKATINNKYEN